MRTLITLALVFALVPALSPQPASAEEKDTCRDCTPDEKAHLTLSESAEKKRDLQAFKESKIRTLLFGGMKFEADYGVTNKVGGVLSSGSAPEELDTDEMDWGVGGGYKSKKILRDLWKTFDSEPAKVLNKYLLDRVLLDATVRYGQTAESKADGDLKLTEKMSYAAKLQYSMPIDELFGAPKYR